MASKESAKFAPAFEALISESVTYLGHLDLQYLIALFQNHCLDKSNALVNTNGYTYYDWSIPHNISSISGFSFRECMHGLTRMLGERRMKSINCVTSKDHLSKLINELTPGHYSWSVIREIEPDMFDSVQTHHLLICFGK
jgi:hypothetical protein